MTTLEPVADTNHYDYRLTRWLPFIETKGKRIALDADFSLMQQGLEAQGVRSQVRKRGQKSALFVNLCELVEKCGFKVSRGRF